MPILAEFKKMNACTYSYYAVLRVNGVYLALLWKFVLYLAEFHRMSESHVFVVDETFASCCQFLVGRGGAIGR